MDHRYPIGTYNVPSEFTPTIIAKWIDEIEALPSQIRSAVSGMSEAQLDTSYREGGWTARQVVHHLPDSHMNAYIRTRLALTEDNPTVKPYIEKKWGDLFDARTAPVEPSVNMLEGLHTRWAILFRSMNDEDFTRTFYHPELDRSIRLDYLTGMYAWHGRHHLAHIQLVK